MSNFKPRTKQELAQRVAQDIPEGAYVNLGIGQPTLVANYISREYEVILHSENGILGMGPAPAAGDEDCRSILGPVPDRSSLNPALPSRRPPAVNDCPDTAAVVVGKRSPVSDHVLEVGGECAGFCAARIWDRGISRRRAG